MHNHGNYIVCLGNLCRWLGRAGRGARRRDLSRLRRRRNAGGRRPRRRRRHRRHGHRQGRQADRRISSRGMELRATLHAVRRGLPRLADQAARWRASTCATGATRKPTASASRSCGKSPAANHQPGPDRCTPSAGRSTAAPMAARSSIISARTWSSVGFVVGLDYRNPWLSPFEELQRFKTHPRCAAFRGRPAHRLWRARA